MQENEAAEDGQDGNRMDGKRGSVSKAGSKKGGPKPAVPHKDDEMQIYLSDIRQK